VDETPRDGEAATAPRRRAVVPVAAIGGVIAVVAVGIGAAWAWLRPSTGGEEAASVYRNTRPGVAYVGDAACVRCHAEIAETYANHPMGRSLTPIDQAPPEARVEGKERDLFEAQGFVYSAGSRDGRAYHRETRRDASGQVVGEVEGEVRYVLGSGTRAFSYLIDRGGYLFQSPVTRYSQSGRWDLAPGYDGENPHLERAITPACLFCHANRVEHVAGTINRYDPPTFLGQAIGCERCHGPGELHVKDPTGIKAGGAGPAIVNPRKLESTLRDAVCEQCHLLGDSSVTERPGRDLTDYRPGLPLHRFETVFVPAPGSAADHKNSGHVEQMHESRCFQSSQGALGCISCHDPHELPDPAERVAYYRDRCQSCHAEKPCNLAPAVRLARSPQDDCVACHMPRASTSDAPHVATTIHTVPRRPPSTSPTAAASAPSRPDEARPVAFHRKLMTKEDREAARRDLGLTLHARGDRGAATALPMLAEALKAHPDDVQALEAEGFSLGVLGRGVEGLAAIERALGLAPDRETALAAAAFLANRAGRPDQAIAFWRRAIAVDPWRSNYHAALAGSLARAGRWSEAADEARAALKLNPASIPARMDLIQCVLRTGSPERAEAEFAILLEFQPPDPDGLRRWFRSLR